MVKMKKGVPKGYKEHWKYSGRWDEVKTGPKTWKVNFAATKRRRAKMGQLKPGTKIIWLIHGKQYAIKTNAGEYQTRLIAKKKLLKIKAKTKSYHR